MKRSVSYVRVAIEYFVGPNTARMVNVSQRPNYSAPLLGLMSIVLDIAVGTDTQ